MVLAFVEETQQVVRKKYFFLFFITLGLELSDTKVYEPYIRGLLGTASQYCGAVVLEPRTVTCKKYRGTSFIRNRHPSQDHHRALDMNLL